MWNPSCKATAEERPVRRRATGTLLLLAAVLPGGCQDGPVREEPLWSGPVDPGERVWSAVEWDTLWLRGGARDTVLQNPRTLRAWDGGVLVWDDGGSRLLSLDRSGALRWSFGEPGRGPDEFSDVRDLQLGAAGTAYVYDAGNERVTVVDSAGSVVRRVPLPGVPHSSGFAVLSDTLLAFVTSSGRDDPVRIVDLDGAEVRRGGVPWKGFGALSALSRQGSMVSEGARWAYAFRFGNGWFPFEGAEPGPFLGGFVEHREFPEILTTGTGGTRTTRIVSPPACAACTISLSDSVLAVHFGGGTEQRYRILDLYHWEDGRYLGSRRLPGPVRRAVVRGGRVYTLAEDPFPELAALAATP